MRRKYHWLALLLTISSSIAGLFLNTATTVSAQSTGTRCTTSGETLFLRFNYVPTPGQGYLENKAIIYVPKEAQCAGTFPMYVHLHGDNKYTDNISPYYLPSTVNGQRETAHYNDHGTIREDVGSNQFKSAIEAAMRNSRVPGMIFVLPVNTSNPSHWVNLNGATLKSAVQSALDSNPLTQGKGIRIGNDTLLSGHSGAACHANEGLMNFPGLNPKAVAVVDACVSLRDGTSVYQTIANAHPNATLLFYAANMAYDNATYTNNVETGGYHNILQALRFQQQSSCDANVFLHPHNPTQSKSYGRPAGSHFRQYWDNPQLWCSKSPDHPWYGLFATSVDHRSAAGLGVRTLINLYFAQNTPTAPATNNTNAAAQTNPNTGSTTNTTTISSNNAPSVSGTVPLEISINGIRSISGNDQGYIINYARTVFLYAAGLTGTLALLVLIVAGLQIIFSSEAEQNKQAKQLIIGSLSGLALLATSGWILYLINPCFFSFGSSSTCTPRGTQPAQYTFTQPVNNSTINRTGTPPPPPSPNCNNSTQTCDVVLPVPYVSQVAAPDECSYDNICATNRRAGSENDGSNPKWGQVSCGAAAFSIAYLYVSGNSTPTNDFLRSFINDYFRCGIHGLPPEQSARIGGYDARSAPRTYNDDLCAYTLGSGGEVDTLTRILKTQLGAQGTRTISDLTPQAMYQALSAGHPIVIGGVIRDRSTGNFVPSGHYTVIIGIRGYNQSNGQFTDLVIHDVGRQANSPLTMANYTSLRSSNELQRGIAVAM